MFKKEIIEILDKYDEWTIKTVNFGIDGGYEATIHGKNKIITISTDTLEEMEAEILDL